MFFRLVVRLSRSGSCASRGAAAIEPAKVDVMPVGGNVFTMADARPLAEAHTAGPAPGVSRWQGDLFSIKAVDIRQSG